MVTSILETVQRSRHGKVTAVLLNEEFEWERDCLSPADPIVGPAFRIEREWVKQAISKMKSGKAAGPLGIVVQMMKASGETGIDLVTELANSVVYEGLVPFHWEVSSIVNSYTGKDDALK